MSVKQIDGYKIYMSEVLGTGSYGSVYVGKCDKNGDKVAIKVLQKKNIDSDDYLKAALFSQIKIMQTLKSPNIVGFYDVMQSSKNYYIIQQLCDGDITRDIMKPGKQLNEKDSIDMLTQICNGFLTLVKQGIIHRDLKPANIMIKNKILKIGDFGFAKKTPDQKFKNKTVVGTPLYMSLQILKVQQYTSKCDIWALGFIFYEMLHGETPWTAKSQYQLVKSIETKPLKIRRNDLSKQTINFLQRCLKINEQDRMCWDELFLHPIFHGFFDNKGQNQQFQNKLKLIMNDLRFYINSKNLDLCKILISLGYYDQNAQMNFDQYYNFLRTVNPSIKKQQALYIFKKTDIDNSNTISIYQIQQILAKHAISLTSTFKQPPKFERKDTQTFSIMSEEVSKKIMNCFAKLHKIITKNKITLKKVFQDFDKEHNGKLSEKQFKHMIRKLDKQMPDDEIIQAFNMIDEDGSKTIQYDELINYYSKVNGIPMHSLEDNFQKMDIEQNKPYQQPQSNNPFMQIQHQNSFPPNYQNYPQQPPPGYYNPYNPYYQPQIPPNYQQPQQKGMFGNFIMNQIQNKMHGSTSSMGGSNKNIW